MDWFLYDNGLRHERVNNVSQILLLIEESHDIYQYFFSFSYSITTEIFFLMILSMFSGES